MHVSNQPGRFWDFVDACWETDILPQLTEYIRIPNKSPHFDPDWKAHGYMDQAVALARDWCLQQPIPGMQVEVLEDPGRTPLLYIEVPGSGTETVLLYGHLDKQPEMTGWAPDLGPWAPVRREDRLYGRGGADDGYAVFASLTAIRALQEASLAHARCVILIECSEESGSPDLPHYVEKLKARIGSPALVICLDSGCGNYEQLWCTTSLRGLVEGRLRVDVLHEGVHSGNAGGIVPSSFRIIRQLLDRFEDVQSGRIRDPALQVEIPADRLEQARMAAGILGDEVADAFPFVGGVQPQDSDPYELILNRTWRAALAVTGAEGLPAISDAGNVLRPYTTLKLACRMPPSVDAEKAAAHLKALLETDPPHGARVHFEVGQAASGWNAPTLAPWLAEAMDRASQGYFGKPAAYMGEGGTIPFMGMLGAMFPAAQFLITGVLGPASNAHGPNEFLHIPTAKRLTCCVAEILTDFPNN